MIDVPNAIRHHVALVNHREAGEFPICPHKAVPVCTLVIVQGQRGAGAVPAPAAFAAGAAGVLQHRGELPAAHSEVAGIVLDEHVIVGVGRDDGVLVFSQLDGDGARVPHLGAGVGVVNPMIYVPSSAGIALEHADAFRRSKVFIDITAHALDIQLLIPVRVRRPVAAQGEIQGVVPEDACGAIPRKYQVGGLHRDGDRGTGLLVVLVGGGQGEGAAAGGCGFAGDLHLRALGCGQAHVCGQGSGYRPCVGCGAAAGGEGQLVGRQLCILIQGDRAAAGVADQKGVRRDGRVGDEVLALRVAGHGDFGRVITDAAGQLGFQSGARRRFQGDEAGGVIETHTVLDAVGSGAGYGALHRHGDVHVASRCHLAAVQIGHAVRDGGLGMGGHSQRRCPVGAIKLHIVEGVCELALGVDVQRALAPHVDSITGAGRGGAAFSLGFEVDGAVAGDVLQLHRVGDPAALRRDGGGGALLHFQCLTYEALRSAGIPVAVGHCLHVDVQRAAVFHGAGEAAAVVHTDGSALAACAGNVHLQLAAVHIKDASVDSVYDPFADDVELAAVLHSDRPGRGVNGIGVIAAAGDLHIHGQLAAGDLNAAARNAPAVAAALHGDGGGAGRDGDGSVVSADAAAPLAVDGDGQLAAVDGHAAVDADVAGSAADDLHISVLAHGELAVHRRLVLTRSVQRYLAAAADVQILLHQIGAAVHGQVSAAAQHRALAGVTLNAGKGAAALQADIERRGGIEVAYEDFLAGVIVQREHAGAGIPAPAGAGVVLIGVEGSVLAHADLGLAVALEFIPLGDLHIDLDDVLGGRAAGGSRLHRQSVGAGDGGRAAEGAVRAHGDARGVQLVIVQHRPFNVRSRALHGQLGVRRDSLARGQVDGVARHHEVLHIGLQLDVGGFRGTLPRGGAGEGHLGVQGAAAARRRLHRRRGGAGGEVAVHVAVLRVQRPCGVARLSPLKAAAVQAEDSGGQLDLAALPRHRVNLLQLSRQRHAPDVKLIAPAVGGGLAVGGAGVGSGAGEVPCAALGGVGVQIQHGVGVAQRRLLAGDPILHLPLVGDGAEVGGGGAAVKALALGARVGDHRLIPRREQGFRRIFAYVVHKDAVGHRLQLQSFLAVGIGVGVRHHAEDIGAAVPVVILGQHEGPLRPVLHRVIVIAAGGGLPAAGPVVASRGAACHLRGGEGEGVIVPQDVGRDGSLAVLHDIQGGDLHRPLDGHGDGVARAGGVGGAAAAGGGMVLRNRQLILDGDLLVGIPQAFPPGVHAVPGAVNVVIVPAVDGVELEGVGLRALYVFLARILERCVGGGGVLRVVVSDGTRHAAAPSVAGVVEHGEVGNGAGQGAALLAQGKVGLAAGFDAHLGRHRAVLIVDRRIALLRDIAVAGDLGVGVGVGHHELQVRVVFAVVLTPCLDPLLGDGEGGIGLAGDGLIPAGLAVAEHPLIAQRAAVVHAPQAVRAEGVRGHAAVPGDEGEIFKAAAVGARGRRGVHRVARQRLHHEDLLCGGGAAVARQGVRRVGKGVLAHGIGGDAQKPGAAAGAEMNAGAGEHLHGAARLHQCIGGAAILILLRVAGDGDHGAVDQLLPSFIRLVPVLHPHQHPRGFAAAHRDGHGAQAIGVVAAAVLPEAGQGGHRGLAAPEGGVFGPGDGFFRGAGVGRICAGVEAQGRGGQGVLPAVDGVLLARGLGAVAAGGGVLGAEVFALHIPVEVKVHIRRLVRPASADINGGEGQIGEVSLIHREGGGTLLLVDVDRHVRHIGAIIHRGDLDIIVLPLLIVTIGGARGGAVVPQDAHRVGAPVIHKRAVGAPGFTDQAHSVARLVRRQGDGDGEHILRRLLAVINVHGSRPVVGGGDGHRGHGVVVRHHHRAHLHQLFGILHLRGRGVVVPGVGVDEQGVVIAAAVLSAVLPQQLRRQRQEGIVPLCAGYGHFLRQGDGRADVHGALVRRAAEIPTVGGVAPSAGAHPDVRGGEHECVLRRGQLIPGDLIGGGAVVNIADGGGGGLGGAVGVYLIDIAVGKAGDLRAVRLYRHGLHRQLYCLRPRGNVHGEGGIAAARPCGGGRVGVVRIAVIGHRGGAGLQVGGGDHIPRAVAHRHPPPDGGAACVGGGGDLHRLRRGGDVAVIPRGLAVEALGEQAVFVLGELALRRFAPPILAGVAVPHGHHASAGDGRRGRGHVHVGGVDGHVVDVLDLCSSEGFQVARGAQVEPAVGGGNGGIVGQGQRGIEIVVAVAAAPPKGGAQRPLEQQVAVGVDVRAVNADALDEVVVCRQRFFRVHAVPLEDAGAAR